MLVTLPKTVYEGQYFWYTLLEQHRVKSFLFGTHTFCLFLFQQVFVRINMSGKLMEQVFNLKFLAKQLNRQAKKCEKEEKEERNKVKKAIEKNNNEGAKIYAQNAIRKKSEYLNFLRLASKLDAVVTKLETQAKMQMVTKNMAGVVKTLEKALQANNLDKVAETMDQFEKQFENLDLATDVVEQAMNQQTVLTTPEDQVNDLMQQVADQHNLELQLDLPQASTAVAAQGQKQDTLGQRMEDLKGR
eukprot:TRINITY_DN150_c0_g1_i4.p2 TRINITY_DN150_c0_g1~~TRINITY_DN150_c0_g1_i4.p2  ORF type:complete len:245 (+),score=37.06 TRINITY_DN150_c0_g1_i4:111-845(+)